MSHPAEARTFSQAFPKEPVLIDERRQISPHFLGIGKTRKIIDLGARLVGFFSTGYAIDWIIADRATLAIVARGTLSDVPVAWGGGQFCIDHVDDVVHLVYTCRTRLHVFHRSGRVAGDRIEWDAHVRTAIAASTPSLAAPWVSVDRQGSVWVSAVGKDGNFIVAHGSARDGEKFAFRQRRLFDGAPEWHHSCVQVLPYGKRKAVAVGFAGKFPVETVLVAKEIDDELTVGASKTIGPCDVNDQITFHFQALGDPERGRAAVTYLGPRGRIDHATWDGTRWRIDEAIVPFQTIAPQNTLLADGEIGVLCADYEGRMFALASSRNGWSKPVPVSRAGLVSISPAFARTGYGTGGVISAVRSSDRRMAFLASELALDPDAPAKLYLGAAGGDEALLFAGTAAITRAGNELVLRVSVAGGAESDFMRPGLAWSFAFNDHEGLAAQIWILSDREKPRVPLFRCTGGVNAVEGVPLAGTVELKRQAQGAEIVARLLTDLRPAMDGAVVAASYDGVHRSEAGIPAGRMIDLVPFVQEPNSIVALEPRLLPRVFRRIV